MQLDALWRTMGWCRLRDSNTRPPHYELARAGLQGAAYLGTQEYRANNVRTLGLYGIAYDHQRLLPSCLLDAY